MTFWEWFTLITGAATLVSLAIAVSSVYNGHATRALARQLHTDTLQVLTRMETNAEARYRDLKDRLDDGGEEEAPRC